MRNGCEQSGEQGALESPDGTLRRSTTIPLAIVYADDTRRPRLRR